MEARMKKGQQLLEALVKDEFLRRHRVLAVDRRS